MKNSRKLLPGKKCITMLCLGLTLLSNTPLVLAQDTPDTATSSASSVPIDETPTPVQQAATPTPFFEIRNESPTPMQNPTTIPALTETPTMTLTPRPTELPNTLFTPTPSGTPDRTPLLTPTIWPGLEPTGTISPSLTLPYTSVSSASIRQPLRLASLPRKTLKRSERIMTKVYNVESRTVEVSLFHASGTKEATFTQTVTTDSELNVYFPPPVAFKPGKYTMRVTDETGAEVKEQFTWGVLAINTNKSIYTSNEQAKFSMAVLDEGGNMVCDAKVTLTIRDTSKEVDELSTQNGKIKVNPECNLHAFTLTPDYEALYTTKGAGIYEMHLTAETTNGSYSISDFFEVRESVLFDVERLAATRIYPKNPYPVNFKITANKDFSGAIVETVPDDFIIIPPDDGSKSYDKAKITPNSTDGSFSSSESESTLELSNPFSGKYSTVSYFGTEEIDPLLLKKYQYFGIIGHDGVDFALPRDTEVLAADDGVIEYTGDKPYGNTVIIRHKWGQSYYGHLNKILVNVGQNISRNQIIALSGNSGLSTGAHLHFSIKLNNNDPNNGYFGKIDPLLFLNNETVLANSNVQQIIWYLDLKKGEAVNLGYKYDAPDRSPQFYLAGTLKFKEQLPSLSLDSNLSTSSANLQSLESVATSSGIFNDNNNIFSLSQIASNSAINNSSGSAQIKLENPLKTALSTDEYYLTAHTIFQEARKWQIAIDAPLVVTRQETDKGSVENTSHNSVTTSTNSTAVYNQLYLASISTKPNKSINSVTGLGLTWTNIRSQCGHRGQTNTAIFYAIGSPTADGTVTASLNGGTNFTGSSVITVMRYSGVDASSPIGNIVSANYNNTTASVDLYDSTNNTVCNGAESASTDSNSFSYAALDTSQTESLAFVATGERSRTLTSGAGYSTADNNNSGASSNTAGVGIEDQIFSAVTTNLTVNGTFSSAVDWGVVSVEILADQNISTPTNDQLMRHGAWFSAAGVEQPFTF